MKRKFFTSLLILITTLTISNNTSLANNKDSIPIKSDYDITARYRPISEVVDGGGQAYKVRIVKYATAHWIYRNQQYYHTQWIDGRNRSGWLTQVYYQLQPGTSFFYVTFEGYLY